MADLIEKLFKDDLTEAEKAELRQLLSTDEEAARRLGEKAGEAYRRFGLPEPHWTGPDHLPGRERLGFKPFLWPLIFLAGLGGFGAWFVNHMLQERQELSTPRTQAKTGFAQVAQSTGHGETLPATSTKPTAAAVPAASKAPSKVPVASAAVPIIQTPAPAAQAAPTTAPTAPFVPKFTPVNSGSSTQMPYSSLSVVLHRTKKGFLKVRVLDAQKSEVLPLFQGELGPGNWIFEWDGRLKNGQTAPPGLYFIQIQAGSWVQTKEVQIQN